MFQGPGSDRLRVLRRQDGTLRIIQNFRGGGTEQHAPKPAGVRWHHDQIESVFLRRLCNHARAITGQENSCRRGWRKFGNKKVSQLLAGNAPVFLGYFVAGSCVELESVVTCEVANMKKTYRRATQRRGSMNVCGHGRTRR